MDIKSFLKKYGAYLVAAVVFIGAAVIYCFPVTQGKVIYAGDNITAKAAVQESVEYTRQTGDHSWWNSAMFSGMPNFQIGGGQYKSSKWLKPLDAVLHRGHSHTAWVFIIYFFCFFVLLRSFDVDKWLSIVGALAIALSSYFIVIIAAGHNGKTSTIALMSVVLAGFYLIFRKKYGLGFVFAMIFTAVGFGSHPQMAYYIFMLIGLLWFAELYTHIKEKRLRDFAVATALFIAAVGIGMGTGCANIFANSEYAAETMRGGHSDLGKDGDATADSGLDIEYATQWSYGVDESLSFMIPGVMGGSSSINVGKDSKLYKTLVGKGVDRRSAESFCAGVPMYWGEQPFTAGNVYMGAIVCFLFVLGLIIIGGAYKWALLIATLFSAALALGHNCMWLTELFFKYFPLYSKFRAVSSILIVAEIAMPLLGFLAVKALMDGSVTRDKACRAILTAGGITGGICLILALFGGMLFSFTSSYDAQLVQSLPDWVYYAIVDEREHLLKSDSWRSLLFIAGAAATLWLFVKGHLKPGWMIATLGVLVICDMWPVDKRYFNDDNFVSKKQDSAVFAKQPYEEVLLQDQSHFRVFNLTSNPFSDARTSYYLKSIGGYSAAKLRRYQDIIDQHLSKMHLPVVGMLNAKYIITSDDNGNATPQVNPYALGNAWFVDSIAVAPTPDAECEALMQIELDHQAVVGQEFAASIPASMADDPGSSVQLVGCTPKSLEYETSSTVPGTVVFSEIYYPYGWKAAIDGTPAEHFRANYVLRALNVPAGKHTVTFVFDPDSVHKGDAISMIFVVLMYLLTALIAAMAIVRTLKKRGA